MKRAQSQFCFILLLLCSLSMAAEEEGTMIPETPQLSPEETPAATEAQETRVEEKTNLFEIRTEDAKPVVVDSLFTKEVPSWLTLGLAFDVGFMAGTPSQQGFSIPFFRLSAVGDMTPWLSYSVKMGQTREVSSAMLPQLLPTEVKVDINTVEKRIRNLENQGNVGVGVGMFIPTFNPFWSSDLNEIEIPAYSTAQAVLFLPQDIGAELYYENTRSALKATIGVFNGSGNFSLNTNNSRVLVASVAKGISLGSSRITWGLSGYLLNQSSDGSLNYKSYQLLHSYLNLHLWEKRFLLGIEGSTGNFNDSIQRTRSSEFAFVTEWHLSDSFSFFGRYEKIEAAPKGDYDEFTHLQLGPVIQLVPQAKLFAYWDYHYFQGPTLNAYSLKLRVAL